jgi:Zn-dependent protease
LRIGYVTAEDMYGASTKQRIFFMTGGCVANLALAMLISEILTRYPSLGISTGDLLAQLGLFSFFAAIGNLIPLRVGRLESDGLQIYETLKGGRHWR